MRSLWNSLGKVFSRPRHDKSIWPKLKRRMLEKSGYLPARATSLIYFSGRVKHMLNSFVLKSAAWLLLSIFPPQRIRHFHTFHPWGVGVGGWIIPTIITLQPSMKICSWSLGNSLNHIQNSVEVIYLILALILSDLLLHSVWLDVITTNRGEPQ